MIQSEFYLNLPNLIWNNLLEKTEDVFNEEEIGTHIVGVYPAGKRIYGIESASPEFICLYIDVPENLLDPTIVRNPQNNNGIKKMTLLLDGSSVTYLHLFDWVQWITNRDNQETTSRRLKFHDLIPCHQDIAYQDQSISNIILEARELISFNKTFYKPQTNNIEYALYLRTLYLFQKTNRFSPNINPDFGKVEPLLLDPKKTKKLEAIDKEILWIDENLQLAIKENNNIEEKRLAPYIQALYPLVCQQIKEKDQNNKRIRKEVIKLYKSLL